MTKKPYVDCLEYLEDELSRYLPLRTARLDADRTVTEMTASIMDGKTVRSKNRENVIEAEHRAKQLHELETFTRNEIDGRLESTRQVLGESCFGIDRLTGRLDADARLIVLISVATALGMGTEISQLAMTFYGSVCVSDLMLILDAKSISDRLRVRRLVRNLANRGILSLSESGKQMMPEDFNSVQVSLTNEAFGTLVDTDPET